jgi:hypothetical protein
VTAARKNRWMRTTLLHGVLAGRVRRAEPTRRRALRLPVVVAVSIALTVPVGLTQAAHAQPGGLGRPDAPHYKAGKVAAVHGLGAAAARAHVTSARTAQKKAAGRALAEQTSHWPTAGTDSGELSTRSPIHLTAGGLPVRVSRPTAGKAAGKAAAGEVQVRSLGRRQPRRLASRACCSRPPPLLRAVPGWTWTTGRSPPPSAAAGRAGCGWSSSRPAC